MKPLETTESWTFCEPALCADHLPFVFTLSPQNKRKNFIKKKKNFFSLHFAAPCILLERESGIRKYRKSQQREKRENISPTFNICSLLNFPQLEHNFSLDFSIHFCSWNICDSVSFFFFYLLIKPSFGI